MDFEVIVVGKGLFGSSAGKYLSGLVGSVAIIGPDEPADPAAHEGVFGAHYDEGRLTYQLKSDPVWADLAVKSLGRFPAIEAASGVRFHTPAGHLYVADVGMDNGRFEAYLAQGRRGAEGKGAEDAKIVCRMLDGGGIRAGFPFLRVGEDCLGIWEDAPAGYLSPRGFIRAQLALARGAALVPEVVTGVRVEGEGLVVEAGGRSYGAEKVLVAAGAYSNGFGLLERPLDLRVKGEYVIRAAVPDSEVERLRNMPPIVYRIDHPRLFELYILPPIRYPDGRYYLKMGANTALDESVETVAGINGWYRDGDSDVLLGEMRDLVLALFPGLRAESWSTHRCVITRTGHGRPYIDEVTPGRVYVAVGGNGQGAKAADEIGRLAARLVVKGRSAGKEFAAIK